MSYVIKYVKDYWFRISYIFGMIFNEVSFKVFSHTPHANIKKVEGFHMWEVLSEWTLSKFPGEYVIVLLDIDISRKGIEFWVSLPKEVLKEFIQSGVVVLRCKDLSEAFNLATNIPYDFADASVFYNGSHILNNGGEEL